MIQTKTEEEWLIRQLELREQRARKRALFYTAIPILLTAMLFWVAARRYTELTATERQLEGVRKEALDLSKKMDSTKQNLETARKELTNAVHAMQKIQAFLELKERGLESPAERRTLISIRMLMDDLNKSFVELSQTLPEMAGVLQQQTKWITVLSTSSDFSALQASAVRYSSRLRGQALAIYKAPTGYYYLAIPGDGSFTAAHRQTVEMKNRRIAKHAYSEKSTDWGPNLLVSK
jgi:hypothetical protein